MEIAIQLCYSYRMLELGINMEQAALPWAIIMSLFVPAVAWWVKGQASEVSRLCTLVNRTREDYMKRSDHNSDMDKVTDHMIRIEGKLDRLAEKLLESK
jgi:hypothetical protein